VDVHDMPRVTRRGAGPALVLLHGWAMHGGVFEPLARLLESRFTLHMVDLPGHGLSRDDASSLAPASVAEALLARLPPALWVGWSLGGLVALAAAQRAPAGQVRGLGMLCASPRFVRGADWADGMDPAIFRRFADDLGTDYRAAVDRFLLLEAQGSDHARDEIRALRAVVFAHGEPTMARLCEGLRVLEASDLRAGLACLAMPSLWLAGRRDRLVPPAAMQRAAAACGGRFVEVAHAGHAPFLTHAGEVADAIDALAAIAQRAARDAARIGAAR
jgi:pimeloyl-[acyl-carrier protein] methyl ester esterase